MPPTSPGEPQKVRVFLLQLLHSLRRLELLLLQHLQLSGLLRLLIHPFGQLVSEVACLQPMAIQLAVQLTNEAIVQMLAQGYNHPVFEL